MKYLNLFSIYSGLSTIVVYPLGSQSEDMTFLTFKLSTDVYRTDITVLHWLCPKQMQCNKIPATNGLSVHTECEIGALQDTINYKPQPLFWCLLCRNRWFAFFWICLWNLILIGYNLSLLIHLINIHEVHNLSSNEISVWVGLLAKTL